MAIDIIARGIAASGGSSGSGDINHIRIQGELNDLPIIGERVTLPLATKNSSGLVKLSTLPVGELDGTQSPIVLNELDSGTYKITGSYVLKDGSSIQYSTASDLFCVSKEVNGSTVTILNSNESIIYHIPNVGDIETSKYLTENNCTGTF